jgi:hypothetical protein
MASYELTTGQKAEIVDEDGNPIPTGSAYLVNFGTGGVVSIDESGDNVLLAAEAIGSDEVAVTPEGSTAVVHTVTVIAAPFDWSLGTPEAA